MVGVSVNASYRLCRDQLTELLKVFNRTQAGLAIGNRRVHEMLLSMLIYREALECQVARRTKLRSHLARAEDGARHRSRLDASLDEVKPDGDDSGHLNGAAEANLAVALAKVQVSN